MAFDMKPRAPAARAKLDAAEQILAELEIETATFALEAAEGKSGAERLLSAHRSKIEMAERQVSELRRAVLLGEKLDRQAVATAAATMRAEQLAEFKKHMQTRAKAMTIMLDAAATMARAFSEFSEATLSAQIAVPSGANVPVMNVGPGGSYGPSFSNCERLLAAELYRIAPERKDGIGRFVLPLARMPLATSTDHGALPPALDEFRAADQAILTDIEKQVEALDQRAMAKASEAA